MCGDLKWDPFVCCCIELSAIWRWWAGEVSIAELVLQTPLVTPISMPLKDI